MNSGLIIGLSAGLAVFFFIVAFKFSSFRKIWNLLASVAFTIFLLEASLAVYYRLTHSNWIQNWPVNHNDELFETSYYTAVSNKPDIDLEYRGVHIKHNKSGYRDESFSDKKGHLRIAALGGSTTYGVGVNNEDTWPSQLENAFHGDTSVFNLSTPGHTAVENQITASLYLEALKADVVLLHVGLNDLRVSNVKNLRSDYSNFHAPDMLGSMGQCYLEHLPRVAILYYAVRFMQFQDWYPVCPFHRQQVEWTKGDGLDPIALDFYKHHLSQLIRISQMNGRKVLVLPQILIPEMIEKDQLKWWIPGISTRHLMDVMKAYNQTSEEIATQLGANYVGHLEDYSWNPTLFADPSHLNAQGNKVFSEIVAATIRQFHLKDSTRSFAGGTPIVE